MKEIDSEDTLITNQRCAKSPMVGDRWYGEETHFIVVDRLDDDQIVIAQYLDGKFDFSKVLTVPPDWILKNVSSVSGDFMADCTNTESSRLIVSEYRQYKESFPSYESLVAEKKKQLMELTQQYNDLLKQCPHTTLEPKSDYFSGSYYDKCSTTYYDQCVVCGKRFNIRDVEGSSYG